MTTLREMGGRSARAPRIETPRLLLRAHEARDLDDVAALWADPTVVQFISGTPSSRQESWARILRYAGLWSIRGYGYWAIEEKETGRFLGDVGLADFARDLVPPIDAAPEAGWVLHPSVHGRGYGSEALRAVMAFADEALDAPRITCLLDERNAASLKLAERCGFRPVGTASHRGSPTLLWARPRGG